MYMPSPKKLSHMNLMVAKTHIKYFPMCAHSDTPTVFFLSFLIYTIKSWSLRQGVQIWNFEERKKQKTRKIFRLCFWLNEECPKLLSSLGIDNRRRKTIQLWNSLGGNRVLQGITVCLVSTILGTVWWPGRFQTASRGQVLVFFYRHSTRMYLMKEKQGGPIPMGLKRWPLKLIKHPADTTCVSPSPAGPTGCCPLNFLYLINLQ